MTRPCERAALQDLELGLILGLAGQSACSAGTTCSELEDARLLLVDAKRRDGGEERSGRERPDRAHDDREQEERDDRPAVADQHPPVVPEMRILFRDGVSPDRGASVAGRRPWPPGGREPPPGRREAGRAGWAIRQAES